MRDILLADCPALATLSTPKLRNITARADIGVDHSAIAAAVPSRLDAIKTSGRRLGGRPESAQPWQQPNCVAAHSGALAGSKIYAGNKIGGVAL